VPNLTRARARAQSVPSAQDRWTSELIYKIEWLLETWGIAHSHETINIQTQRHKVTIINNTLCDNK
jgi:hypothetical protein